MRRTFTHKEAKAVIEHVQDIVTDDNYHTTSNEYGDSCFVVMHIEIEAAELPIPLPSGRCLVKYRSYQCDHRIRPENLTIQYDYDEYDFGYDE